MGPSFILRVVALALFIIAGISAFSTAVNVNETGFLAFGFAAWVGSTLVADAPRRGFVRGRAL